MITKVTDNISKYYTLKEKDCGEYSDFKAGPMKISLHWYEICGLGNLSILNGSAMFGLMKMDTIVINPIKRDMPLFSYDYINAMGNITMLIEYYNTLLDINNFDAEKFCKIKESLQNVKDKDLGKHWYDSIKLPQSIAKIAKKNQKENLQSAFYNSIDTYVKNSKNCQEITNEKQKREKSCSYVNGLLENGGPSTDAFIKALGTDKTSALFRKIIFASEE